MKTINSLSGGKTSSYLSVHYPADIEIFALVCNDDPQCGHNDKKVMQMANDKLAKQNNQYGEFVGTPEHSNTVLAVLELEQMIGREIIWVRDISFDLLVESQKSIPNRQRRFCTTFLKMRPIFNWWMLNVAQKVKMRAGYRADEFDRANTFSTIFKYAQRSEYQPNSDRWINRWEEIDWRVGDFPLIEDRVFHRDVQKFWQNKNIDFPPDSNCQMCFWKPEYQLRKNFEDAAPVMQWAKNLEKKAGYTFKDRFSMEQIEQMGLQGDLFYGGGASCQSGFCTD